MDLSPWSISFRPIEDPPSKGLLRNPDPDLIVLLGFNTFGLILGLDAKAIPLPLYVFNLLLLIVAFVGGISRIL